MVVSGNGCHLLMIVTGNGCHMVVVVIGNGCTGSGCHLTVTRSDKIMVYVPSSSNSLSLVSQVHNLGFSEVILDISQFK